MRLTCPLCGARDRREYTYLGEAQALSRPDAEAPTEEWHAYLHLRDNPAGWRDELWYHEQGCGAWLVVTRHTTTHEMGDVRLARDVAEEARS